MKKRFFIVLLAILLTSTNNVDVYAKETSMANFKQNMQMIEDTFSDVNGEDWFYKGVAISYNYGIMEGVGGGRFMPNDNLTQAQAIAIVTRLHAVYNDMHIPEVNSSLWYEKYFSYALDMELLPSTISDMNKINEKYITRSEIAFLFSKVMHSDDLPAINDLEVPDIAGIRNEFAGPVKDSYASGIIGGKPNGIFDGKGLATRAEAATIISRLIDPTIRLAHDKKYNHAVLGQEGNLQNSKHELQIGDDVYIVYRSIDDYGLKLATTNLVTGYAKDIYESSFAVNPQLLINDYFDGELYLVEERFDIELGYDRQVLVKIDLNTLEARDLFIGNHIVSMTIYDGKPYIIDLIPSDDVLGLEQKFAYKTYRLEGSSAIPLFTGKTDFYVELLFGYNDKLYYTNEGIFEYNLKNRSKIEYHYK